MQRTWWEMGISTVLLLLVSLSVNCALDVGGLPGGEVVVVPPPEDTENAYTCHCTCVFESGIENKNLNVCIPPGEDNIVADCKDRVELAFDVMTDACVAPVSCSCNAVGPARFDQGCNTQCPAELLDQEKCSNFDFDDPAASTATQINASTAPVCLVPSATDASQGLKAAQTLPTAAPTPLAAGITGRRSTCAINAALSIATVTLDGDAQQSPVSGVVEFLGAPCPGAACALGMAYQLSVDEPFAFSGFCAGTEISDVRAVGSAGAEAVVLDAAGVGQIAAGQTLTSARGTRTDSGVCIIDQELQMSFVGTNVEPLDVIVDWGQNTCTVTGALLGTTVENKPLSVEVSLHGTLENQPPIAKAGTDQTVECSSSEGVEITLDGTGSSDPDNNIALVQWHQGSRTGALVGEVLQVPLPQGVGTTEQYVLRVIDAAAQGDEDTTTVQVVDTTAPSISNITATPNVLGPPNHTMVPVTVAVAVTDSCDTQPICQLTSVSSNEPVNGTGDGNTSPDWEITGPLTVNLRAERAGGGSGRVYTLTIACQDAAGNQAQGTTIVTVPHGKK